MKWSLLTKCVLVVAACAGTTVSGCRLGGGHDKVHKAGDEPAGVQIQLGEIAVSPSGTHFVFKQSESLGVGVVSTGSVERLPVNGPSRLAFSKHRPVVYVTTNVGELHAVHLDSRKVLWTTSIDWAHDVMIVSSDDDRRVVVGSDSVVGVHDADDGTEIATRSLPDQIVDLELLPDDERVLAVSEHKWNGDDPTVNIDVVEIEDGTSRRFSIPNCSADIVVPKAGDMALLAPTFCRRDPISHIDLEPGNERFVRNLPGFGPVALGPDGKTAVGFLDMSQLAEELFDDPEDIPVSSIRFHLMVIDTSTMSYDFYPWGSVVPRYAMTPDGSVLLVDAGGAAFEANARLFDLKSRNYVDLTGPKVRFSELTFTSDSSRAYLLSDPVVHVGLNAKAFAEAYIDYNLFTLDVEAAHVAPMLTDFRPRNINLSPDDGTLFLRRDDKSICVYSIAEERCARDIDITLKF